MYKSSSVPLRNVAVVASTSLIAFLHFGTSRLSAQLFVECIERFNTGRKEASLPFILCFTGRNLSGPIIGYLGNKYGLNSVTLAGCMLSAVAVGGCYFVEDIVAFTVLWGGFFGIGFGMGTVLIPNILHLYFKENFNLMLGIVLSSGSIGSLVLPVITDSLLKNYGTSGTLLILSSIILHCIPAAMLLGEPEMPRTHQSHSRGKETNESPPQNYKVEDTETYEKSPVLNGYSDGTKKNAISPSKSVSLPLYEADISSHKELYIETSVKTNIIDLSKSSTKSKILDLPIASGSQVVENIDNVTTDDSHSPTKIVALNEISNHSECQNFLSDTQVARNLYDATIYESLAAPKEIFTEDPKTKNKKSEIPQINSNKNQERKKHAELSEEKDQAKLPSISAFRKFEVFLDPAYILILVSIGLSLGVATTLFTVIVDACRDKYVTEDVTVLIIFALTDMLGRIGFGYIADGGCITPLRIFASCYGSCGLLLIGFTWFSGFYTVLIFVAGLGILAGGVLVLPVGIIANYVQKENLTMAISSKYFLFALLSFSQSPIIGYFRETLRSYNGLFYSLGGTCILGTIITLFIPLASRWRDNRRNNSKNVEVILQIEERSV